MNDYPPGYHKEYYQPHWPNIKDTIAGLRKRKDSSGLCAEAADKLEEAISQFQVKNNRITELEADLKKTNFKFHIALSIIGIYVGLIAMPHVL